MEKLRDAWESLVWLSKWIGTTVREHPLVSLLVLGAGLYGWFLSIQIKRKQRQLLEAQLREQQSKEERARREGQIEKYIQFFEDRLGQKARAEGIPVGSLRFSEEPKPEPGEDPALVREAWKRFVQRYKD